VLGKHMCSPSYGDKASLQRSCARCGAGARHSRRTTIVSSALASEVTLRHDRHDGGNGLGHQAPGARHPLDPRVWLRIRSGTGRKSNTDSGYRPARPGRPSRHRGSYTHPTGAG
jgi:hypothetical protein